MTTTLTPNLPKALSHLCYSNKCFYNPTDVQDGILDILFYCLSYLSPSWLPSYQQLLSIIVWSVLLGRCFHLSGHHFLSSGHGFTLQPASMAGCTGLRRGKGARSSSHSIICCCSFCCRELHACSPQAGASHLRLLLSQAKGLKTDCGPLLSL